MNALGKLFLKGLIVVIPIALTLAILWWTAAGSERLLGGLLKHVLPTGYYLPGMGLVTGMMLIVLVGLLSHALIIQRLFEYGEGLVNRLPLIKTLYSAIKDFVGYFSPGQQRHFSRAVLVRLPGQDFQLIGFVTRETFNDLPLPLQSDEPVAVYCPMSYQIGGYTLFLPRSCLQSIDLPFEEAMRLAVTGGITQRTEEQAP